MTQKRKGQVARMLREELRLDALKVDAEEDDGKPVLLVRKDYLLKLLAYIERVEKELLAQWTLNHDEHCSNEWPHPTGSLMCHWPPPPFLVAE